LLKKLKIALIANHLIRKTKKGAKDG